MPLSKAPVTHGSLWCGDLQLWLQSERNFFIENRLRSGMAFAGKVTRFTI